MKFIAPLSLLLLVACSKTPAPVAVPVPVPVAVVDAGSAPAAGESGDMASFIKAVATCTKGKVIDTKTIELMGTNTTTTAYEIVDGTPEQCTLVITPLDHRVVLNDKLKAMLKEKGETPPTDAEVSAKARAKENIQQCTKPGGALAKALSDQEQGTFDSEAWAGCIHPFATCAGDPPAPAVGCGVGACDGGAWPITCGAETCRLEGEAKPGMSVGCSNGSVTMSFH